MTFPIQNICFILGGSWDMANPTTITVGSLNAPVSKMVANLGKLWCTCGGTIKIFNTNTLTTENTISVCNDTSKSIACIVISGNGVWLSLQNSAIVKCFHVLTFELIAEINVAPAVTKMLTSKYNKKIYTFDNTIISSDVTPEK